jgi:D-erythro-7,8-dihydroneopterin triphosphate epimerase
MNSRTTSRHSGESEPTTVRGPMTVRGGPTLDAIEIKDLLLRTILGTNPEERVNRQDVVINLTLFADTRQAGESDNIEDTVNYKSITKRVIDLVERSEFLLVEKMAAEIARVGLEDPRVGRVRVSVEKPGALRFARSVGITIERTRE